MWLSPTKSAPLVMFAVFWLTPTVCATRTIVFSTMVCGSRVGSRSLLYVTNLSTIFTPDHEQIFKVLSKKAVYVTGKFSSNNGAKAVKCALGANEGHLYPLNKVRTRKSSKVGNAEGCRLSAYAPMKNQPNLRPVRCARLAFPSRSSSSTSQRVSSALTRSTRWSSNGTAEHR